MAKPNTAIVFMKIGGGVVLIGGGVVLIGGVVPIGGGVVLIGAGVVLIGGGVVLIGGGVVLIGGGVVLIGGGVGLIMLVFSSLARILGECLIIHSLLALFFFFQSGYQLAHTKSTLYARIGPQ